MTSRFVRILKSVTGTLAAAARAGSAVEGGRRPRRQDLAALGIDRGAFHDIGR